MGPLGPFLAELVDKIFDLIFSKAECPQGCKDPRPVEVDGVMPLCGRCYFQSGKHVPLRLPIMHEG